MSAELSFFEQVILVLIGIFGTFGAGLATWYLKKNEDCKRRIEESVDKIDDRTLRQSKSLLNLSRHLDEYKEITHADLPAPKFHEKMKESLQDGNGNL